MKTDKINIDNVTRGYLACAEWADKPEGSSARFPRSECATARKVCAEFIRECGPAALQAMHTPGYSEEHLGHDFWLTRCGHGTGFWDREELFDPLVIAQNSAPTREGGRKPVQCETLGEYLTAVAYGADNLISPFAYPDCGAYRGWLTIDGSAEHWARGHASPWGYFKELQA